MPSLGLAATLGWNLGRHLRGKSTVCAWLRFIPWPILRLMLGGFFVWWWTHLRNGYN